jgi:preprotein translocase subunit Sec61beta
VHKAIKAIKVQPGYKVYLAIQVTRVQVGIQVTPVLAVTPVFQDIVV